MADVIHTRTTTIRVESTVAEQLTVGMLRDFVAALDTAGVPDTAEVRRRGALHRGEQGLYVAYTIDEPPPGPGGPGRGL